MVDAAVGLVRREAGDLDRVAGAAPLKQVRQQRCEHRLGDRYHTLTIAFAAANQQFLTLAVGIRYIQRTKLIGP